jgi:Uma2 family endonuclease
MIITSKPPIHSKRGEPVWELAKVFPAQGHWTEEEYLEFDRSENMLVEYTDGYVAVLPMPTRAHQKIVLYVLRALLAFVEPKNLGEALCAPLPFKLRIKKWRESDIIFTLSEHIEEGDYPEKADLIIEVVSADRESHARDYKQKRTDYAGAGIPEYWIVDPKQEQITVLKLQGRKYIEHGVYKKGAKATSNLLKGFGVEVTSVFNAARK